MFGGFYAIWRREGKDRDDLKLRRAKSLTGSPDLIGD
jgi:hypothetical protein